MTMEASGRVGFGPLDGVSGDYTVSGKGTIPSPDYRVLLHTYSLTGEAICPSETVALVRSM